MLPIWRDNWLFLLLDEKNSRERDVPERLLVEPSMQASSRILMESSKLSKKPKLPTDFK